MNKLRELLILCSLLWLASAAHICTNDGVFQNPDDATSYIECKDGQNLFRRCPRTSDGKSYQVFNGRECTESPTVFTCPTPSGLFRYIPDERQYYECRENTPVLRQCVDGTVFDGLQCSAPVGPSEVLVAPEFECPRVEGVFANPSDRYRYTYYECANGVPTKRNCPSYTAQTEGRYHQDRMVFDGQSCVRPHRHVEPVPDYRRPVYEERPELVDDRLNRRQVIDNRCPVGREGLVQSATEAQTWYDCVAGAAVRVYVCESGLTLDPLTKRCKGTRVQEEEVVVHRPGTVEVETNPRIVDLGQTRPVQEFYPDRGYYGRRFRRNGRVEFEDESSGRIIVDTWNEGAWRWDRDLNGRLIPLPQVNDWQSYDYRLRTGGYPQPEVTAEYRRPAVEYIYRPTYQRRERRYSRR